MNRKEIIFKTATSLFSAQGYEATTTLQIAKEVGVTEPAVFYHFKNKEKLFSTILKDAALRYMNSVDKVTLNRNTPFECLESIIRIHFSILTEEPELMRVLLRNCPARLMESKSTCFKVYLKSRLKLKEIVSKILYKGVTSGDFIKLNIDATTNMFIAMLNGLMRQQIGLMDNLEGVEMATIMFCKNALNKPH